MTATIDLAAALREQGFVVTPHLSARMIKNRSELSGIVSRLFREGIDRAFVVGGDADDPGQFKDALELLRELSDLGHHLNEVGVTGYPEGHPFISGDLLRQALIDKQRYATYIATQMCFDAPAIVTWVKGTRLDGVRLPINVGIPGVVDPIRLAGIAARIGVGTSVRYVTKNRKMIWRFLRPGAYRPTKLLRELGAIDPALGLRGLHIFTFNLIEPTVAWFQESVEAVRGR
jgi:methylenetetrahydrofolate reductase (NADPH)